MARTLRHARHTAGSDIKAVCLYWKKYEFEADCDYAVDVGAGEEVDKAVE